MGRSQRHSIYSDSLKTIIQLCEKQSYGVPPIMDSDHSDNEPLTMLPKSSPPAYRASQPIQGVSSTTLGLDEKEPWLLLPSLADQRRTSPDSGSYGLEVTKKSADGSGTSNTTQKHLATFQCSLCPKTFSRQWHLRSHLGTHNPEEPFICGICGNAFALPADRAIHEHGHRVSDPDRWKATLLGHGSIFRKAEPADLSVPDAMSTQGMPDLKVLYSPTSGDNISQDIHTNRYGFSSRASYTVPATPPADSVVRRKGFDLMPRVIRFANSREHALWCKPALF